MTRWPISAISWNGYPPSQITRSMNCCRTTGSQHSNKKTPKKNKARNSGPGQGVFVGCLPLASHGFTQSMSRKGNCLDNAVIERFFGTLKCELFYREKFTSIEQLEKRIHEYIYYYNHERVSTKLKGLSPVQYRNQSSL